MGRFLHHHFSCKCREPEISAAIFCFMTDKQGLGKLHFLISGRIIEDKHSINPYTGSMNSNNVVLLLED